MKREAPVAYMQFSDHRAYVVIALVMLVAAMLVSLRIERSRFGLSLIAIKQNEWAAEASGIDTWRWKMKAIMVSGAIAAAAGGFYAVVLLIVTPPTVFGMLTSAQALISARCSAASPRSGAGDRRDHSDPARRDPARGARRQIPESGRRVRRAIVAVIMLAPEDLARSSATRGRNAPGRRRTPLDNPVAARAGGARPMGDEMVLQVASVSRSFGGLRAVRT
jgi:branched-chain amino acid transport system permease protein